MRTKMQSFGMVLVIMLSMGASYASSPRAITKKQANDFAKTFKPTGVSASQFTKVEVIGDLEFAKYGDQSLELDLYLPAEIEDAVACVVTVTGGGFRARGKDAFARYAAYLATQGFAAACISYRGTPDDQFPSTVHDCKAAIRFVPANASKFRIDADRIGILGQSAGGYLAAMIAVSGDEASLDGEGGNTGVSSRVQAAVSFSGVFDFILRLREGGQQTKSIETKKKTNGQWVGEAFSADSELWKRASPINYLSPDDAPLMMLASKTDDVVPQTQSVQMYGAMQEKGLTSELLILETGGHGIAAAPAENKKVWSTTIDFLRRHLN